MQIFSAVRAVVDPTLLEKLLKFIARLEPKSETQFVCGDTVLAEGLDRGLFEQGPRGILSSGKNPMGEFVRNFDDDLHTV